MRRALLVILSIVAALVPTGADAKWTQVRSANFVFIGDASEGQIRRIAEKLEQFREVMLRAIPGAPAASAAPIVVVVFASDASFTPYKPIFEGRTVNAAGLFLQTDDIDYMLLNADVFDEAFKVVFHEYSHFLITSSYDTVPLWLNEGMAEVYATFQERDGGRGALLGAPDRSHLRLLQESPLIPLRELVALDHTSPTYNEGSRRGVLYAQSWALVDYLMLGSDARRPQLQRFLDAVRHGTPSDQAFDAAFGDIGALDKELASYIRRLRFPVVEVAFGVKVDGGLTARGEPLAEAQALAYLADAAARLGRVDAARAQLRALVDKDARAARALCALGLIERRAGNYGEALPLLERAAALAPDEGWIQTAFADALIRRGEADGSAIEISLIERARTTLSAAAARDDAFAHTLAVFGRAHLFDGGDPRLAVSSLERALKLVPGRQDYQLMLAHALLLQHEYARATAHLGPLIARASQPEVRDQARRLLAAVSRAQGAEPGAQAGAGASSPGRMGSLPALRRVGAGETRVFGKFSAVECGRDGLVLRIDADGRTLRLSMRTFDEVQFLSYRDDGPRTISCGDQRPAFPVFATFRGGDERAGIDGIAVAIEMMEDRFIPPR